MGEQQQLFQNLLDKLKAMDLIKELKVPAELQIKLERIILERSMKRMGWKSELESKLEEKKPVDMFGEISEKTEAELTANNNMFNFAIKPRHRISTRPRPSRVAKMDQRTRLEEEELKAQAWLEAEEVLVNDIINAEVLIKIKAKPGEGAKMPDNLEAKRLEKAKHQEEEELKALA